MELLSTKEAADFLGVPVGTLKDWRYHGRAGTRTPPPAYRAGRHIRYDRAELEQWLRDSREDYAQPPAAA